MKTNRRKFIQTTGLAIGAAGLSGNAIAASGGNPPSPADDQVLFIGDNIAVADTQYGKVRGYMLNGIYTYLGIPYGADTGGKNRFMPPQKPAPWEGVRDTIWWGNSAPQIMDNRYGSVHYSFADHWNYDDVSEDCLRLNVWTPAVADGKKRPVIVWLHGGGFTNGNGIEQDGYHGENLSRKGDVVFVSINHRLGPIGFTDLSGVGGEKYASSGNVGALDMVAALEWVRDNIANFGGDPGNVTIIGQSGGGAKVCVLTAMPAAKGLVHKAVALSGSSIKATDASFSKEVGRYILEEAGLQPAQIDKLQELTWREYLDLAYRANERMRKEKGAANMPRGSFGPVADGVHLPAGAFYADGTGADIPMIICTTFNEQAPSRTDAALEAIGFDGVKEKLEPRFGAQSGAVVDAYRAAFPTKKPVEIWSMAVSNRQGAIRTADAKSKQKAPVYLAWFGWQPPLYDGRMRSFHCIDICFWFYNTDRMYTHTGGGARPRRLSESMSDALLAFMRTGDPNTRSLPAWPKYNPAQGATMVLDDSSEVQNDPDREARKALPG